MVDQLVALTVVEKVVLSAAEMAVKMVVQLVALTVVL